MQARLVPTEVQPVGTAANCQSGRRKPLRSAPQLRAARYIADCLGETGHGPIEQIVRLVQCVGMDRATQFLEHALAMEATGRMLRPNYARDASRGTIFFHLVHESVEEGEHAQVFARRRPRKPSASDGCP